MATCNRFGEWDGGRAERRKSSQLVLIIFQRLTNDMLLPIHNNN